MSIYLAYDGSINANWIARYAVRMAANHPEKRLHVVYIEDADIPAPELSANMKQIEDEAQAVGVEASSNCGRCATVFLAAWLNISPQDRNPSLSAVRA